MFLYVVFILLPATALAVCEREVYWNIFKAVDLTGDGKVDHLECSIIFLLVDVDLNGSITLGELIARIPLVAPLLIDHEITVLKFMDHTGDGMIDSIDIKIDFDKIDTDHDGKKTKDEYKIYLDKYCKESETEQTTESSLGDNNSVTGNAEKK